MASSNPEPLAFEANFKVSPPTSMSPVVKINRPVTSRPPEKVTPEPFPVLELSISRMSKRAPCPVTVCGIVDCNLIAPLMEGGSDPKDASPVTTSVFPVGSIKSAVGGKSMLPTVTVGGVPSPSGIVTGPAKQTSPGPENGSESMAVKVPMTTTT